MSAIDRLIEADPFDFSAAGSARFVESFREAAAAHYAGNAVFRAFWDDAGIRPDDVRGEDDIARVPPIMVHLFKERRLVSVPDDRIALTLTSSGTGGQKSAIYLDAPSLARVQRLAYRVHEALGITSPDAVNYLCFTYDPGVATDLGTAFTDKLLTGFTGAAEIYYALQFDREKGDFVLNERGVVETLARFAAAGLPVRILGFPAFLHRVITRHDLRLNLGPRSWVQTGGGWKALADEEIPKPAFRRFVADRLGIPEGNIRDLFGMVEHGIPYVDCRLGNLHIPNYARVLVRRPHDLGLAAEGETGLLQFLCSYCTSYPSISLLTTDWGRLGRCTCGLGGHTLEILGRAGVTKHKGCAIKAAEMLKE